MTMLVDHARLRSFTDGDQTLETELLDLFALTAERYLDNLEAAQGDAADWRAVAHSLKGAASNIGAVDLAALAAAAERSAPDPESLAALRASFAATRRTFAAQRTGTADVTQSERAAAEPPFLSAGQRPTGPSRYVD